MKNFISKLDITLNKKFQDTEEEENIKELKLIKAKINKNRNKRLRLIDNLLKKEKERIEEIININKEREEEAKIIINKYNEKINGLSWDFIFFATSKETKTGKKECLEEGMQKLKELGYIYNEEEIRKKGILLINEISTKDLEYNLSQIYKKYICDIYGHEYYRTDDWIHYSIEGSIPATYTDRYYEDERTMLSPGREGTRVAQCKYCGQKIMECKSFPLDYIDKINIDILNNPKQKVKTPQK